MRGFSIAIVAVAALAIGGIIIGFYSIYTQLIAHFFEGASITSMKARFSTPLMTLEILSLVAGLVFLSIHLLYWIGMSNRNHPAYRGLTQFVNSISPSIAVLFQRQILGLGIGMCGRYPMSVIVLMAFEKWAEIVRKKRLFYSS
ncbi:MAG: hypothetical protein RMI89_07040 [Gloeomargarita sp. SKYBB_i_bin120]|nr:hypothetical protein [Gloeomargarita sp. SKYG98]MCS7292714.1 hypothetical protein [Gloeomargarita sp. SKYB120]MDW8178277.1 hypothetical protein [Gloeomargarita sp. SKYBB_i_bin120]